MTGLDRLRELADDMAVQGLWGAILDGKEERWNVRYGDGMTVNGLLRAIADQIEAEQEERITRRLEDREAAEWVRAHGGLDSVKKLLGWVVGHCSTKQQLDFDFWLSGRVMYELGFEEDMADRDEVERRLLARLMPEGYEWPRYESGEPLRYEDRYVYDGREREVWHVDFDSYGEPTILNKDGTRSHPDKGERVERPAPKVLAADGEPLEVGQTVWDVLGNRRFKVLGFGSDPKLGEFTVKTVGIDGMSLEGYSKPSDLTHQRPVLDADGVPIHVGDTVWTTRGLDKFTVTNPNNGKFLSVSCKDEGGDDYCCYPTDLTHRAPVLAADGLPLREGEHVYHVETGAELVVKGLPKPGEYQAVVVFALPTSPASHLTSFDPDQLTHTKPERPVLDADGVPIRKGDTVYEVEGTGYAYKVVGIRVGDGDPLTPTVVTCDEGDGTSEHFLPSQLTHAKHAIDSWKRIEEDAGCTATKYNERRGTIFTTKQQVARDLVRRAKALAERERGE